MNKILRATETAHLLGANFLAPGQTVIDATCGKGCDTLFLAERVGASGRVYAFDIQEQALEHTRALLREKGLLDRVDLVLDSHENFAQYVSAPVSAIFYNLGYLPGGSKKLTTRAESTLRSLTEGMKLMAPGGFISIVAYPEHAGGEQEAKAVERYLQSLPAPPWYVLTYKRINSLKPSPFLLFVEKNG